MTRRDALAGLGTVSLGALFAACGGNGGTTKSAQVLTTEGGTATVEPSTETGSSLSELFDDSSACTLTPEQTEGPYYFDADAIRSDITEGREGAPLRLALRVRDADCEPTENAVVDVWQCDASGVYSGFEDGQPERFLRGAQATNADGIAQFRTIFPGSYAGRTVHIHAKLHLDNRTVLTTQLYFDDETTDAVFANVPYGTAGERTRNEDDAIFDERLVGRTVRDGDGWTSAISFDVAQSA